VEARDRPRIDSDLGKGTGKNGGGVEVSKRRRRGGIGQIVGGHVNCLHRGYDPFLVEVIRSCNRPFCSQVRLISTALGMRPNSAETSLPAWVKRKMLSMNNSVSLPLRRGKIRRR